MGTKRSYGDACRFAFALDLIGERWALLIVRELLLGPKRFTDLRRGLPNASPNILSERLRELEQAGVVHRRKLPPPAAAQVYELTEWGKELELVVTRLGAWGARSPAPPEHREIGPDSIVLALRSLFDPEAAAGLEASYELRLGDERFHVDVAGGELELGRGAPAEPAAAIETDPGTLAALLTGQLPLEQALESGTARVEGGKKEVRRFLGLFPMPEPCPAGRQDAPAGPLEHQLA
ncbi:MAG TPA: winged helix-turn-helix transcriptional regulator [Solirubrobacterales bacterium]|nr:winged helix-turn-helix transcriptional regulator [Solirubrobacterales bacterium]